MNSTKNDPFSLFINFVTRDAAWRDAQKELEAQERHLALLYEEERDKHAALTAFKESVQALFKIMHNYELEAKVMRERMAEARRKLEFVESPREYTALHKELDELAVREKTTEELLFTTWQEHEVRQGQYADHVKGHELWLKDYEQRIQDAQRIQKNLTQKVTSLEQERAEFEKSVPADFLDTYYDMKRSVVDPVVPVINNYCSSCRCLVAQQDLAVMRRHVLVKCKECYRVLYVCQ